MLSLSLFVSISPSLFFPISSLCLLPYRRQPPAGLRQNAPFGSARFGTVHFPCPLIVSLCARSSRHRASIREPNLALCPGVHSARGFMLWHVLSSCCCSCCCCGMRSRLCCSLSSLRLSVIISCAVLTAHTI